MAVTKEVLTLAVDIGDTLLRNGSEVYRVEDTVIHILEAYQIADYDVYVLSNGIFASANEGAEDACSIIRHVPSTTMHLARVTALNQLSREICSHECSLIDAWIRLDECKHIPESSHRTQVFFSGLGSGCFCFLFGGGVLDCCIAFIAGALLQLFLFYLASRKSQRFINQILGSALVTTISIGLYSLGVPMQFDKVIIGSIMPLVPGIAFTTSIRDFFNADYLSGTIHIIDALLTAFSIAVGVGTVITFYRVFTGGALL